jgi:hypothetical protein
LNQHSLSSKLFRINKSKGENMIELIGFLMFATTYLLFVLFGASKEDKQNLKEEFLKLKQNK